MCALFTNRFESTYVPNNCTSHACVRSKLPMPPGRDLLCLPCRIMSQCESSRHCTQRVSPRDFHTRITHRYNAVRGWEAAALAGAGERFVRDNFLSHTTLRMLQVQARLCSRCTFFVDSDVAVHAETICRNHAQRWLPPVLRRCRRIIEWHWHAWRQRSE